MPSFETTTDALAFVAKCLSILASLAVIIALIVVKLHHEQLGKLMIMLSFSGMIYALPVYEILSSEIGCRVAEAVSIYGMVSLEIWVFCFGLQMVFALLHNPIHPTKLFVISLLIAQGIPAILAVVGYNMSHFDTDRCRDFVKICELWQLLLVTRIIPTVIFSTASVVCYIICVRKLGKLKRYFKLQQKSTLGFQLSLPLFMVALWIPVTIVLVAHILQKGRSDVPSKILDILNILTYMQPLMNAIAFVLSTRFRIAIQHAVSKGAPSNSLKDTPSNSIDETAPNDPDSITAPLHLRMDRLSL